MQKNLLRLAFTAALILGFHTARAQTTIFWDQNGATTAGAGATPSGTWQTGGGGWNTGSGGSTAAATWANGNNARFSAGTDAINPFTVTVSGTIQVNQIGLEEAGTPTFTGGVLTFTHAAAATSVLTGVNGTPTTAIINSQIAGTGGFKVARNTGLSNVVRISNPANSWSGGLAVNGDNTLQLLASEVVPDNNVVAIATATAAGVFDLNGFTETVASISGSGNVNLGAGRLILNSPAGEAHTGLILGTTGGITKNGAGTLTLGASSAANTFTGPATNNAGTLILANSSQGRTQIPGDLVVNGGTVQQTGAADLIAFTSTVILNGGTWQLGASGSSKNQATLKALIIDNGGIADIPNSSSGTTITNGIDARSGSLGGPTSGGKVDGPSLTKSTAGTVTWTSRGSSTTIGVTNTTVNGGTLILDYTQSSSKLADAGSSLTVDNGSALVLANGSHTETVGQINLISGSISNSSGTASLRVLSPGTFDVRSGSIKTVLVGSGALTKSSVGTVTISSPCTYSGTTTITIGTLALGINNALPSATTVNLTGGTLAMGTFNDTVNALQFIGAPKAKGTWGSLSSTANHKDAQFTGTGILTVTTGGSSTLTLTSDNNPSLVGSTVNFTATVTGANNPGQTPSGTVTFFDGATPLGTSPVSGSGSTVTAVLGTSSLTVGTHTILASYSGDANFDISAGTLLQTVYPPITEVEYFYKRSDLPPTNGVYIPPPATPVQYGSVVIRDGRHRNLTPATPPPSLGATQTDVVTSEVDFDLSTDGGATFTPVSATANCQVKVVHSLDANGTSYYDTEMLQLDLTASAGAASVMLRESPTLQSLGKTTIRQTAGGFMISSFFDVFTEVSLDGGATWTPASAAHHVALRKDARKSPGVPEPTPLLPPPNDHYVSPADWHALYAQGIVITNASHRLFTQSQLPPGGGGTNVHTFTSSVDMKVSTDGGLTFQDVRATAPVQISITSDNSGTGPEGMYDTEMLQLDLSGLPSGIMIRESPSLPSRGGTEITQAADGTYRIHSFFDVFTEVSTDGGASWSAATNGPVHMELASQAPEKPTTSPNVPPNPGSYVSPAQWHALYAMGIIITNTSHDRFTQNFPPPPPGGSQLETFSSTVHGQISTDGGATFQQFDAPANVAVQVSSRADHDNGNTRYFDTEMLQLDLSGGTLPAGVMIRESPSKASLGRTSVRAYNTAFEISSFFDVFTEVSTDGGASWSPQVTGPGTMGLHPVPDGPICSNITVFASSPSGRVVTYTIAEFFGDCPFGHHLSSTPPSGSTFPIGTTVVTVTAWDDCGLTNTCSFTVTVTPTIVPLSPEYFSQFALLPPPNSVYISPALWHTLYNNGIVIRDVSHRKFTQSLPPPPLGASQVESFGSELDFEVSFDNGATFQPGTGLATVQVKVTHTDDDPGSGMSFFDTEMLQLDLTGPGFMLRESPTLQSLGKTTVRQVPGGYMISSFFDIFTEVSLDGGASWTPAQDSGHMEMRNDPANVDQVGHPTDLLPPPTGAYISPQQWHALYAAGIVIKDVSHKFFTDSFHPPAAGSNDTHSFNSVLDLSISLDGGATYQSVRATAPVTVSVTGQGSGSSGFYDTEMLQLDVQGLPSGIMIRESPTLPSRGGTLSRVQPDGSYRIGSFFDIFTEISLDGGASWSAATNGPVRMELTDTAPENPKPTPNLPPQGTYVSPAMWHALYASGIVITNVSHSDFLQTFPPPPPGGQQVENFGSQVSGQISMDGGATFQPFSAPATVFVHVDSHSSLDTGTTRFFDTEMLGLQLSGGSLPGGVMVRESPSKASLGRTSVRTTASDYRIGSFFDIFTEVSLDSGQSWSPSVTAPGTMALRAPTNNNAVILNCSTNIVVTAGPCTNCAVVFFNSTASGGACAPVTVSCNPPSGSCFPIGTNIVTCTAFDCGAVATNCSFTVTVLPPAPCPPLVLTCSSNITVNATNCGANGQGAVVTYSSSATGGCFSNSVVCNPPSGSTFPIGTTFVTCTAHDGCGNSTNCSFTVTVNPCPPIVLTCSSNIVVNATNCGPGAGANVFYSSSVSGGCGTASVSCNPPSGTFFPIGTTTVTCTAFECGVVATNCSFTVTVNPPVCPPIVLTCSSNITVTSSNCGSSGVAVFYNSTATGGCAPTTVNCNPPSGSTFPIGTTFVTCTASDACGNHTNCSFTVTVNPCPSVVLTCSSNIVVNATNCGAGSGAIVNYTSSVSGGCGPANVSCNPPSGSFFPIGTTTVTCSAFDCGIVATNCSFTVTVNPPVCPPIVLTCSSNITITTAGCTASNAIVNYSSSATGGCGPVAVNCNPPSGSSFPPGTTVVTCTATDNCGNKTNCSFNVTVNSGGACPPIVLTCSSNIVVNATNCVAGAGVVVNYTSSATGGCAPTTVTCNPPSGSTFPIGTNTVTCVAHDACGNTTNCSFTIVVRPPVCPPIVLTCSSNITIFSCSNAVVTYNSSATGGCGPVTVSCSPPSGSTFPANTSTLVTCTATDACGNTTNCSFAVTVQSPNCAPIVLHCPKNIKVVAKKHFGTQVFWTSTATGGCPPTTVTCSPPSGTFFPVGVSTLVTCTACDSCGNCTNCTFAVTVLPPHFIWTHTPVLPFTNTVYISPATWHALYAQGIVIRDVRHRFFTTGQLPPPLGTTQVHTFDSQLDFEMSTDNGNTFQQVSAPATTSVSVTHSSDDEGIESYDTEMLSLDVQGLPGGMRLRESPTLQSLGQTALEPTPGGFMASSFFDIFTEISMDNGQTWLPADDSAGVEMRADPRATAPGTLPSQLLPPPAGVYVSPQQWHALYAQGIVIKDVKHKFFTQSLLPPPAAGTNNETFNSTVDMQISTDGGNTFQFARVAAPVQVSVRSVGSGNSGMYETEMTQLDLSGSSLPAGVMIRESPSLPSRGGTQIDTQPDGTYRISSFFDIFTEVSLDGGNTWAPATNGPVHMELTPQTIEVPSATPNLPQTNLPYISPAMWHALYANGIIITNVSHSKFTQTQPPPGPNQSSLETFNSAVDGQVSMDGGHTFTPFSATATAAVRVTSRAEQDSSSTRHFDTEMLSLDVQGLPNGIRLRESPSKQSLGRTSVRTLPDGTYRIGSFFDIFTEISLDNGQSWSPSTTAPATMSPRLTPRKRFFPLPNLPPTNGQYISPKQWHALYANGIIISNVTHRRFLQNFPPPPKNSTNIHNFGSQVNFLLKMPGQPFVPMTANADCQVSVGSSGFQSKEQVYQTEMLSLNLSGGSLPPGVMIRESPTRRSAGESHYSSTGNGYRISSFFDIFTEISLDNGATWSPASSPGSMELHIDPGVPPTTVVNPRIVSGVPTFTVQSQLGLKYVLQYKDDLLDPTWTTGPISSGTGDQLDLIDCCPPPGPSRPHRFYRVEVQEDDSY